MTASSPTPIPDNREAQISALADRFRDYLSHQTDSEIVAPRAVASDDGPVAVSLTVAFERLDASLGQIIDFATAYAEGQVASDMLEPLVLPAAALAGEYLRAAVNASWIEPDPEMPDSDASLDLALPGGIAIDLVGVVRAALLSGAPNLSALVRHVTENNQQ